MIRIIAILINVYLIVYREIYHVIIDVTDVLYINKILSYFGNFLLIIPIAIIAWKSLVITESTIFKFLVNVVMITTILSLIGISVNDLMLDEWTNLFIYKIYHPMFIEVKRELFYIEFSQRFLTVINQLNLTNDHISVLKPIVEENYVYSTTSTQLGKASIYEVVNIAKEKVTETFREFVHRVDTINKETEIENSRFIKPESLIAAIIAVIFLLIN